MAPIHRPNPRPFRPIARPSRRPNPLPAKRRPSLSRSVAPSLTRTSPKLPTHRLGRGKAAGSAIKRIVRSIRVPKVRPATRPAVVSKSPFARAAASHGSRIDWRRNQPVVNAFRKHLPTYFPLIRKAGGYNPRKTGTGKFSAHSEGRALDIYLNAKHPGERSLGDALASSFRAWSKRLGVDHVIWNGQIWSRAKGGPRKWDPTRNQHTNHIHVAFSRPGSQTSEQQVLQMLNSVRTGTRVLGE